MSIDPLRRELASTQHLAAVEAPRLARTGWSLVVVLEILGLLAFLAALALLPSLAFGADELSTSVHPSDGSSVDPRHRGEFSLRGDPLLPGPRRHPGDLMTQLSFSGREGAGKEVEIELLDQGARTRDRAWVHGSDASGRTTRGFPIDTAGWQVTRLRVKGSGDRSLSGPDCVPIRFAPRASTPTSKRRTPMAWPN